MAWNNYDKTYDIEAMKIVAKLIFNGMYSFCFMESFFIDKVYSWLNWKADGYLK